MSTQKMMLGAMLLLSWGCRSGTEPAPEPVAVGSGGLRQVLTGPEVRVDKMNALPTPGLKGIRHFPLGINSLGEIVGTAYGDGSYAPVAWRNYDLTMVEVLGDPDQRGEALAINDKGQVVGWSPGKFSDAVQWQLGVPGHVPLRWESTSQMGTMATDVNTDGLVVGVGVEATGSPLARHVLLWRDGIGRDLGEFNARHVYEAHINAEARVVATVWSPDATDNSRVRSTVVETDGVQTDLFSLRGGQTWARDINAAGQVVGGSTTAGGEMHAFLWEAGLMTDLGTLGGTFSLAYGINERGHVVGESTPLGDGDPHAVIWVDGAIVDLGVLADNVRSVATGINDQGQIIGLSYARCDPMPVVDPPPQLPSAPYFRCNGPATPTVWAVALVPPSPAELTDRLDEAIASLEADGLVTQDAADALKGKLDAATAKLNDGNEAAAAGILRGFIGVLGSLVARNELDAALAADLRAAAELAVEELSR